MIMFMIFLRSCHSKVAAGLRLPMLIGRRDPPPSENKLMTFAARDLSFLRKIVGLIGDCRNHRGLGLQDLNRIPG